MSDWLIYGAYGYTGRRIVEEAARRGLTPVLSGRDPAKVAAVAQEFHCPAHPFPLDDADAIARRLAGMAAVLHCAGPFSATAEPMMEACLRAGVHYLDITGEIPVIERAAQRHAQAVAANIVLMPAVGFDVVPSDCLALLLAERLPGATRLELAFAGVGRPSPGTTKTMLEGLPQGGRARIDGRIQRVPLAWKAQCIPFRDGPRWAMTVPWGDVASAWYSTKIPNIEVYLAMPRAQIVWMQRLRAVIEPTLRILPPAMLRPMVRRMVAAGQQGEQRGPSAFWGRVSDGRGGAVSATLQTLDGYQLTVFTSLAAVEKLLAGPRRSGYFTPGQAFGARFILEMPATDVRWHEAPAATAVPPAPGPT